MLFSCVETVCLAHIKHLSLFCKIHNSHMYFTKGCKFPSPKIAWRQSIVKGKHTNKVIKQFAFKKSPSFVIYNIIVEKGPLVEFECCCMVTWSLKQNERHSKETWLEEAGHSTPKYHWWYWEIRRINKKLGYIHTVKGIYSGN